MDELIFTLEKQLSKKKAIKQGAMQELLTGKKRLPGFKGEWQNFNLMKHSKIKARIGWQGLKNPNIWIADMRSWLPEQILTMAESGGIAVTM